jgi:preprotein translocase subunit YajC
MKNHNFYKFLTLIAVISLIILAAFFATSCVPMTAEGSTTVETNPDGTPVSPSGFARYGTWIWLIILVVAFYFLLIRPQRQRTKTQQDLLGNLQRGDEILTVGGIYGRVKDVGGDSLIVTISSGVDIKISKSAVAKKLVSDITTTPTAAKKDTSKK